VGNEGLPHPLPVLNSFVIMKFKVNRNHFFNGLSSVTNVVGNRATMPILQNVLIEAEGDTITLTTTNLDLGICCRIKASVSSQVVSPCRSRNWFPSSAPFRVATQS